MNKKILETIAIFITIFISNYSIGADLYQDMSKPYSEYTWAGAHNSHAKIGFVPIWAANQRLDMYKQMNEHQIRELMIDIKGSKYGLKLWHGGSAGFFVDRVQKEIVRFLDENKEAVIFIETEIHEDTLTKKNFVDALKKMPSLVKRIFNAKDSRWDNFTQWPTLQQLVDADQRVIWVVDEESYAGSLGVMYRNNVTAENMWAVTDSDSCKERHGYNKPIIRINRTNDGWPRLLTMNHFGMTGDEIQAGNDNNWDGLYSRIETCTAAANIGHRPNFLAVDYVRRGDVQEIAEVLNEGGIIFYEGENATDKENIVCGIGVGQRRIVRGGEHGCENDEAVSAKFVNVPKGVHLRVFDSEDYNLKDDFVDIVTKKALGNVNIESFEKVNSNHDFEVSRVYHDGIDGKISRFEIYTKPVHLPKVVLFKEQNGKSDVVCTIPDYGLQKINFKNDGIGCNNDKAKSLTLYSVPTGAKIVVYDSPDGKTNDDYTEILVKKDIREKLTIGTFERSYSNEFVKVTYHKKNGLNGKVSRVKTHIPKPFSIVASSFNKKCLDVNSNSQNVQMWNCNGTKNQTWFYDHETAQIKTHGSNRCLDAASLGGNLYMSSCHNGANQKWDLHPSGVIRDRKNKQCLDIFKFNKNNGANVQMYNCNGYKNQLWTTNMSNTKITGFNDKCLSANKATSNVEMQTCTEGSGQNKQRWTYNIWTKRLKSASNNEECLDASSSGNVYMNQCHDGNNQKWRVLPSGEIKDMAYGQCLDLYAFNESNGANVEMYRCNNLRNQEWIMH